MLVKGFEFQDERITLVGPSGIWEPRQFQIGPLSITTDLNGPHEDKMTPDGFLSYKYQGVLICSTADQAYISLINTGAGLTGVYHIFDIPFYYYNLRQNAENRAGKFLKK
ncbi:MAG: hypothetical protein M0Q38_04485 [Bacteroidales bacterium]|jgi:hypothetical protein|nr:hypothetical protein [Bacteroidales bacterium]